MQASRTELTPQQVPNRNVGSEGALRPKYLRIPAEQPKTPCARDMSVTAMYLPDDEAKEDAVAGPGRHAARRRGRAIAAEAQEEHVREAEAHPAEPQRVQP